MRSLVILLAATVAVKALDRTGLDNNRWEFIEPPFQLREHQQRQQQEQRPVSFSGHSDFLNFGKHHRLGFAAFPSLYFENTPLLASATPSTVSHMSAVQSTVSTTASANADILVSATPAPKSIIDTSTEAAAVTTTGPKLAAAVIPTVSSTTVTPKLALNLTPDAPVLASSTEAPTVPFDSKLILSAISSNSFVSPEAKGNNVRGSEVNYLTPDDPRILSAAQHSIFDNPKTFNYVPPLPVSIETKFSRPSFSSPALAAPVSGHAVEPINYIPASFPKTIFRSHDSPPPSLNLAGSFPSLNLGRNFGHLEQTRNSPFASGLRFNLGGFGGIDYDARHRSNPGLRPMTLTIAKVGLSPPEVPRPPVPAFTKIGFGHDPW